MVNREKVHIAIYNYWFNYILRLLYWLFGNLFYASTSWNICIVMVNSDG